VNLFELDTILVSANSSSFSKVEKLPDLCW
jgi:hypothetical protein